MTAKSLGTKSVLFSLHDLKNFAKKYNSVLIYHLTYLSFYSITCQIKVLFGARKFFSVFFGGKSPFLSLVGPVQYSFFKRQLLSLLILIN